MGARSPGRLLCAAALFIAGQQRLAEQGFSWVGAAEGHVARGRHHKGLCGCTEDTCGKSDTQWRR